MELQNLQWKIHLAKEIAPDPHEWFRVFGTWIPDSPEVFVDVADYSHVEDGPVVFLAGHQACYSLDGTGRRLGLLYDRRLPLEGSNAEKLRDSLLALLRAAQRLEGEASFAKKPVFLAGDLKLIVNNRALSPNAEETLAAIRPDLESLLGKICGPGNFSLSRDADPRKRFGVKVKAASPVTVDAALKRLESG